MNGLSHVSQSLLVDERNFEIEVLRADKPTLVAFGSYWSKPCQVVLSTLEEVEARCRGKLRVALINADDNPDLDAWYGIESIPTLLFFVNGLLRARIVGTVSAQTILSKLGFANEPASTANDQGPGPTAYDAGI